MGGERVGVVELDLGAGLGPGCTAQAKTAGKVVQVRVLNAAFRGTPNSLCFLHLAPAQRSDPKKCHPRLLRRWHFEGSENWAGARRRERKKKKRGGGTSFGVRGGTVNGVWGTGYGVRGAGCGVRVWVLVWVLVLV